jgi:hypothetical protein
MYIVPLRGSLYLQLCRIPGGLIPTNSGLYRLAGQQEGDPNIFTMESMTEAEVLLTMGEASS